MGTVGSSTGREENPGVPLIEADCGKLRVRGVAVLAGRQDTPRNGTIEGTNASGAAFSGERQVVRRCIFSDNGQLGFSAGSRTHSVVKVLGRYWRSQVTPGLSVDRPKWATARFPGSAPMGLRSSREQFIHGTATRASRC